MKSRIFAEYPDVVSARDLQAMLHVGRNTAYSLLKSGAVSNIRIGKKYIIPKASVEEFLRLRTASKSGTMEPSDEAAESPERSK